MTPVFMPIKSKWTDADLREYFDMYNAAFFHGRLPVPRTLQFRPLTKMLGTTRRVRARGARRSQRDKFDVFISSVYQDARRIWAWTLLHEMVHMEQRNKYSCSGLGVHFNRRMLQLAKAGAFDGLW